MRVLLISHTCQSPTEGQPKAIALGRRGDVTLEVVVPTRWKHYGRWRPLDVLPAAEPWVKPRRVMWPWLGPAQFYAHWYPGLGRVIRRFKPDVIDLWEEPWGLVSLQAARLRDRWAPDAALVSETEQNLEKSLPMPFERIRRNVLGRADWLVGRSAEAVAVARRKGFAGEGTVLPNAVDDALFVPLDRAECRAELGLGGFVMGYVGRIVKAKGLADLLEALTRLPAEFNAVLVGEGPDRAELEGLAVELGVADRVTWLGRKPLAELPKVMNAIDTLVLPSRTTASWKEQFGRVLIEAEACGTPAMGSTSGAISEVIGDPSRVFAEADPASLAECAVRLQAGAWPDDPAARARLRERACDMFSWDAVAARYVEVWKRAVAARRLRELPVAKHQPASAETSAEASA